MGISTHILDTSLGRPAADVPVQLERKQEAAWTTLARARTDADGRCRHLLPDTQQVGAGTYRIRFETAAYFEQISTPGLYPYVEVVFEVRAGEEHFHIPLLLTANGYSTYRGS